MPKFVKNRTHQKQHKCHQKRNVQKNSKKKCLCWLPPALGRRRSYCTDSCWSVNKESRKHLSRSLTESPAGKAHNAVMRGRGQFLLFHVFVVREGLELGSARDFGFRPKLGPKKGRKLGPIWSKIFSNWAKMTRSPDPYAILTQIVSLILNLFVIQNPGPKLARPGVEMCITERSGVGRTMDMTLKTVKNARPMWASVCPRRPFGALAQGRGC